MKKSTGYCHVFVSQNTKQRVRDYQDLQNSFWHQRMQEKLLLLLMMMMMSIEA